MLLAIDVGNTNITTGVFKGEELIHDFRISSVRTRTSDEYGLMFLNSLTYRHINAREIKDVIISSVVPQLMHTLSNTMIRYFSRVPIVVNNSIDHSLNIKYDNPSALGADRIVTSVAALEKYGGPCIVIDVGTAMTFCILNENRDYLGGLILPGIGIAANALTTMTAKLPKIEIIKPEKVICTETVASMQAGLYYGFTSQIDGIVDKIVDEMGVSVDEVNVIATGGFATLLASDSKHNIIIDRFLTLDGLRILYDRVN